MKFKFDHNNFNVTDMEKSIQFYKDALGLEPVREKNAEDGSYRIVYLSDGESDFTQELTWLRDWEGSYDLGDEEFHICLTTEDYEGALKKHQKMDCVAFINEDMGVYFITDPDGYWIEIKTP